MRTLSPHRRINQNLICLPYRTLAIVGQLINAARSRNWDRADSWWQYPPTSENTRVRAAAKTQTIVFTALQALC